MVENLVKLDFKKNNIRDIQKALEDTKNILEEELLDTKSIYNEYTKLQFIRIIELIDKKNLLDMLVEDIEKYIKTLIDIINFIA